MSKLVASIHSRVDQKHRRCRLRVLNGYAKINVRVPIELQPIDCYPLIAIIDNLVTIMMTVEIFTPNNTI